MINCSTTPINLKNVSVQFGTAVVHKDISFRIEQGEVVTIMGPSGTGKTLLLKMMIGLLKATAGEVNIFGSNVANVTDEEMQEIRTNIGMLFQGAALFDSLSVFENVAYSLRERLNYPEDQIASIVSEKLQLVNLSGIEHKFPSQLSGGQRKRIGLARALASSPKVMLFDEPTTGLDPTSVRLIDDLIINLKRDYAITSIIVTHDMESAKRVSDRWILINNGLVVADGKVGEVSKNELVHNFVAGNWEE
ncbi:MAG: ATP-binding cassette domain-containing protein [bacterium]|nr:ATP-binding cassette domain-containing protein [bacterium]